jgi:hypothetical protein
MTAYSEQQPFYFHLSLHLQLLTIIAIDRSPLFTTAMRIDRMAKSESDRAGRTYESVGLRPDRFMVLQFDRPSPTMVAV